MRNIRILLLLGFVGVSSAVFYSCQKNAKEGDSENLSSKQLQAKIEKAKLGWPHNLK